MTFVNKCKRTGKFLLKDGGYRHLVDRPIEADKYESREDARDAGEHFGSQPYSAVSYSSVRYLNGEY